MSVHHIPEGHHSITPSLVLGDAAAAFGHRWTISTHVEEVSPEEMDRRFHAFMEQMATD